MRWTANAKNSIFLKYFWFEALMLFIIVQHNISSTYEPKKKYQTEKNSKLKRRKKRWIKLKDEMLRTLFYVCVCMYALHFNRCCSYTLFIWAIEKQFLVLCFLSDIATKYAREPQSLILRAVILFYPPPHFHVTFVPTCVQTV